MTASVGMTAHLLLRTACNNRMSAMSTIPTRQNGQGLGDPPASEVGLEEINPLAPNVGIHQQIPFGPGIEHEIEICVLDQDIEMALMSNPHTYNQNDIRVGSVPAFPQEWAPLQDENTAEEETGWRFRARALLKRVLLRIWEWVVDLVVSGGYPVPLIPIWRVPRLRQQDPILKPPLHPPPFSKDINPSSYPPDLKLEGSGWFIVFNPIPKVKRVLDVNLAHTLQHETSPVLCVKFSPDGKWIATGYNGTAEIYDLETAANIYTLRHTAPDGTGLRIDRLCFSPDSKHLATAADDYQIRLWVIAEKKIRNTFQGHEKEIKSLCFAKGRYIISSSVDGTVRKWDLQKGTSKVLIIDDHYQLHNRAEYVAITPDERDHYQSPNRAESVAITPDERHIAVGSFGTVSILEVTTGRVVEKLRGHKNTVSCVAFTPNGKGLISGSFDSVLKRWDVSRLGVELGADTRLAHTSSTHCSCQWNFTDHSHTVSSVAISHDSAWVISQAGEKVLLWNARTGAVQCVLSCHKYTVYTVDFSPTGQFFATAGAGGSTKIWSYSVRKKEL